MHALGGGQVERTLSAVGRYRTGLPGPESHEPGGEDLSDLIKPLGGGHAVRVKRIHLSVGLMRSKMLTERELERRFGRRE